jgi:DNA-binding transcriptional regulator YiaG
MAKIFFGTTRKSYQRWEYGEREMNSCARKIADMLQKKSNGQKTVLDNIFNGRYTYTDLIK